MRPLTAGTRAPRKAPRNAGMTRAPRPRMTTTLRLVLLTSLLFALSDRPGALGEVLVRFGAHQLSLTKLESRPIPSAPFTYRFYVDVLGHAASAPFQSALDEIRPITTELHVLGTYAADPAAG